MVYQVQIMPAAQRQLKKLDPPIRRRVIVAIEALAADPRPSGVRKLADVSNGWRIRVGDYRILYEIHDRLLVVLVVQVGHRGDVYR